MKISFKLLLLSICVIIIGTSFVGCNKNYSEEISFFNYGENIDEETIKEFEKQYDDDRYDYDDDYDDRYDD